MSKTKVKIQASYIIVLKSMAGIFKMVDLLPPQNKEKLDGSVCDTTNTYM